MFDLFKIGVYILLFIPGYIFVQTKDHHLLREKKGQLEKTLEIVLWSAIIWVIAFAIPSLCWFTGCRDALCTAIRESVWKKNSMDALPAQIIMNGSCCASLFVWVCVWSFVSSSLWGYLRKKRRLDSYIKYFTGRDWYPSVALKFFRENIDKAVEVGVGDRRYIGVLVSAPDTKEDKYIIIEDPQEIIHKSDGTYSLEKLNLVDFIVIKFNNIDQIKSFKGLLKKKE